MAEIFGLDEERLRSMMSLKLSESNINGFGRFDELKRSVDKSKAKEHAMLNPPKVNVRTDKLLREFVLSGGFEIGYPQ